MSINTDNIDLIISTMNEDEHENRSEESWTNENESLLLERLKYLKNQMSQHKSSGYKKKKMYTYLGLPTTVIPAIMSPISIKFENYKAMTFITPLMFLISGVLGGVMSFFNPKSSMEEHFRFESKYFDLITDIETELSKKPKFRVPSDVFNSKIQLKMDHLAQTAPII